LPLSTDRGSPALTKRSHRLLVVQPLPGIGDMVWHLPHIRALARHAGAPLTLLAKPRSRADQIFAAEDTVRDIIWVDRNPKGASGAHDGVLGLWRLIRTLRAGRFDAAVLLHHSPSLAFATLAAGIPLRQGYGVGAQRWFLNRGPRLTRVVWRQHRPMERATLFMKAANITLDEAEPRLPTAPEARLAVRQRLQDAAQPFVVLGIGSSEPTRQWGARRFAGLARALIDAGWPSLALVGGPDEATLHQEICAALGNDAMRVVPALGWHLAETAALLAASAFYIGNDTGVMNMAAAVGTRAYALFGTTPVLHHSPQIVPIVSPPGGPVDGVARVSLEAALAIIQRDRGSLGPMEDGAGTGGPQPSQSTRRSA
jgi:heptosyltransferase-2